MRKQWLSICLLVTVSAYAVPAVTKLDVKETMTKVIEPTSNAVFYVGREAPQTDAQWQALQQKTAELLKAAKSLTKSPHGKEKQWQENLKQLIDAATSADKAAQSKNVGALEELNEPLYNACADCHEHYMPKR